MGTLLAVLQFFSSHCISQENDMKRSNILGNKASYGGYYLMS